MEHLPTAARPDFYAITPPAHPAFHTCFPSTQCHCRTSPDASFLSCVSRHHCFNWAHHVMRCNPKYRRKILRLTREDRLLVETIIFLSLLRVLHGRREVALLVEAIKCLSLLSLLLGRCKILRLYRLTPSLISTVNVFCNSQAIKSRDAKSCVSQARIRY